MARTDRIADQVSALLLSAALTRQIVPDATPWNHGWSIESYRKRADAAAASPHGPVAFSDAGVVALEEAVNALLQDRRIRHVWAEEDLWQLTVDAVSTIPFGLEGDVLEKILYSRVAQILNPGTTVVAFAVSNATWQGPPVEIGEAVLGQIGPEWLSVVRSLAANGDIFDGDPAKKWALDIEKSACGHAPNGGEVASSETVYEPHDHQPGGRCGAHFPRDVSIPTATVFATKSRFQFTRSIAHASERFNEIVDLALLLEAGEPETIKTSRPAFSRPARRGLVLDRVAIEHAIARTAHVRELASNTLVCSRFGASPTASWHEAEPLNLAALLSDSKALRQIEWVLAQNTPLSRRLRIAARWYSQAHWSEQDVDAVLALGIALDALVGDKSGLPTSALAERYGLLESVLAERSSRSSEFREMYQVRSAVAHGSLTPTKVDSAFRAKMVAAVRWATQRIIAFDEQFSPAADSDVRVVFENLRWGTAQWT